LSPENAQAGYKVAEPQNAGLHRGIFCAISRASLDDERVLFAPSDWGDI
jgi:hypothetical protein